MLYGRRWRSSGRRSVPTSTRATGMMASIENRPSTRTGTAQAEMTTERGMRRRVVAITDMGTPSVDRVISHSLDETGADDAGAVRSGGVADPRGDDRCPLVGDVVDAGGDDQVAQLPP